MQVLYLGLIRDDDLTGKKVAIKQASKQCDVINTTGGISNGDSDMSNESFSGRIEGHIAIWH